MSLLHDAYAALLSGLTIKTENEIHWQNKDKTQIMIEPVDIERDKYIIRKYYPTGRTHWEEEYQGNQRHGKSIGWYNNGNKEWENEYYNGRQHGKSIRWSNKV